MARSFIMSTSKRFIRTLIAASLLGSFVAVADLSAAESPTATVNFSPPAQAKLERYGKGESAALQARIAAAVVSACSKARIPPGVTFAITVLDVVPTHPTREQLADDPALDPVRTRYLGGADLTGYVRDSRSQVLATVQHRYFPPSLRWRSRSFDSWADANVAIEQFAQQMGAACRRLPGNSAAG
jgi:hypothetical protein